MTNGFGCGIGSSHLPGLGMRSPGQSFTPWAAYRSCFWRLIRYSPSGLVKKMPPLDLTGVLLFEKRKIRYGYSHSDSNQCESFFHEFFHSISSFFIPSNQSALTSNFKQIAFRYRIGNSFAPFSYLLHCLWSMPIPSAACACVILYFWRNCFKFAICSIVKTSLFVDSSKKILLFCRALDKRQMCSKMIDNYSSVVCWM